MLGEKATLNLLLIRPVVCGKYERNGREVSRVHPQVRKQTLQEIDQVFPPAK